MTKVLAVYSSWCIRSHKEFSRFAAFGWQG